MTKPPPNARTLPLRVQAEMALQAAYEKVVIEHARDGRPMYFWEDGKVVVVSPEELKIEAAKILAE
jgi:hypothetical protein